MTEKDLVGRKELETIRWIVKEIDYGVNVGSNHMEIFFRRLSDQLHDKAHKLGNEIQAKECEVFLSQEEKTAN